MRRRQVEVEEPPEFWTAYADLLLTVLVIFIVVASAQIAQAESGARAVQQLDEIGQSRAVSREAMKAAISEVQKAGLLTYDTLSGAIRLESDVLFERNSASIADAAVLKRVAREVLPNLFRNSTVESEISTIGIEGHTSTDGNYTHNLVLSTARAQAAAEVLLREIAPEYRLRLEGLLTATGYSESRPIVSGGVEDTTKSRRMELHVLFREEARLKALLDSVNARVVTRQ